MKRVVGYVRVSSDKQADKGISIETQVAKVRATVVLHEDEGWELQEIIEDAGESAKSLGRPGMERLLAMIDGRSVDVLVIAKLDRLTRSVRDLAELLELMERRKVSLVSVAESLDTGSAAGRLVLNIMMSVSQWEREAISERTRDVLRHKKSKGERIGSIAYGYRLKQGGTLNKNGKLAELEEDPEEKKIINEIFRLRGRGRNWTVRTIAEELNRLGYRMRNGQPWQFVRVAQILKAKAVS